MFKKRTNAKAYAAAKKQFKASASEASDFKTATEKGSFPKDSSTPGDSTKTNPSFLDANTALPAFEVKFHKDESNENSDFTRYDKDACSEENTATAQESVEEFPELSFEFCAENTNSLKGSFKSGHLTVLFETRTCLPPLDLTKAYSEDFLFEYEEYLNYEYSTVTICNDEESLCLLYLPLAEEMAPGIYRYKYSDGQIIEYYDFVGFVQFVKDAIQECLDIPSIGPKIVEIPDKKRNIRKKAQKAKARCSRKGNKGADKEKAVKGADKEKAVKGADKGKAVKGADKEKVVKGADKEKVVKGADKEKVVKGTDKRKGRKGKNVKRTNSRDIDSANILKGSAHTHCRFTRSMAKCC